MKNRLYKSKFEIKIPFKETVIAQKGDHIVVIDNETYYMEVLLIDQVGKLFELKKEGKEVINKKSALSTYRIGDDYVILEFIVESDFMCIEKKGIIYNAKKYILSPALVSMDGGQKSIYLQEKQTQEKEDFTTPKLSGQNYELIPYKEKISGKNIISL